MADRLINLLKVIQWVSNGATKKPRFNNSHSQSLDLTTKKYFFSSALSTSFKSLIISSDILLNYKLVSLNDKHVDVWRSTASSPHLPVQLHAPPAMLNNSSAIPSGHATVLLKNCQYHFRHQSEGIARERKSTCSLSSGAKKAASAARLSGKAISSRCQLALKNNFYFSLMLRLPPKCFQC